MLYIDNQPADVQLPSAIDLKVAETEPGLRGDTASGGGTKPAVLETGARIQVPLFIDVGETWSGRHPLGRVRGPCVGPSSAAPRCGRCTRATCSGARSRRPSRATSTRSPARWRELVRAHQPELDAADLRARQRLVAGADRAAGALDPARRAGRAALPGRAARRAGDPRRGRDRRGGGDGQALLRRRCAGVRQRDPRGRVARAAIRHEPRRRPEPASTVTLIVRAPRQAATRRTPRRAGRRSRRLTRAP